MTIRNNNRKSIKVLLRPISASIVDTALGYTTCYYTIYTLYIHTIYTLPVYKLSILGQN